MGIERKIFAEAYLALHIFWGFNSGIRPNAGGANGSSNIANNKARFIRTLLQRGPGQEPMGGGSLVPGAIPFFPLQAYLQAYLPGSCASK
jgi:hypothetical protein